jgi:hypothetical protein
MGKRHPPVQSCCPVDARWNAAEHQLDVLEAMMGRRA